MRPFRRRQIEGEVKRHELTVKNLEILRKRSIVSMAHLFMALQADPWEDDAWQGVLSPKDLLVDNWYESPYVNIFEGGYEGLRDMGDLFTKRAGREFPWAKTSYRSRVTLPDKVLDRGDPLHILRHLLRHLVTSLQVSPWALKGTRVRVPSSPIKVFVNYLGTGNYFLSMGAQRENGDPKTTFYLSGIFRNNGKFEVATREWEVGGGVAEVLQPGARFWAIGMLEIETKVFNIPYPGWYSYYPTVQVVERTSGERTIIVGGGPRIHVDGDREKVWQLGQLPFCDNDMYDLIYKIVWTALLEIRNYYSAIRDRKVTLRWPWPK